MERTDSVPRARILDLPIEIRLRIYELTYNARATKSRLVWEDYSLQIRPGLDGRSENISACTSPFTLLRVCRQLYSELGFMLPMISEICFKFVGCTQKDLERWLTRMSDEQVSHIRRWHIQGLGECQLRNVVDTVCDRALRIDSSRPLDLDQFERTTREYAAGYPGHHFYKGFYLLRVCDDVVHIPKAQMHPDGSIGQCNSVAAQQHALANLISDAGEVAVTKKGLLDLLDAVLKDEIPGGPGRRHLE